MNDDREISRQEYERALNKLFTDSKGMRENVDECVATFRQEAGPRSETALKRLRDDGYIDERYTATPEKGGVLAAIHQAFFSHLGEGERVMPDGVRVVWDALCSCYMLPESQPGAETRAASGAAYR